jgi:hypothetical protein
MASRARRRSASSSPTSPPARRQGNCGRHMQHRGPDGRSHSAGGGKGISPETSTPPESTSLRRDNSSQSPTASNVSAAASCPSRPVSSEPPWELVDAAQSERRAKRRKDPNSLIHRSFGGAKRHLEPGGFRMVFQLGSLKQVTARRLRRKYPAAKPSQSAPHPEAARPGPAAE